MKAITPVIAIVLLLAITISIVAFSITYFQRLTTTGFKKSTEQMENIEYGKNVVIDSISTTGNLKVYLRWVGPKSVNASEIALYVDGNAVECNLKDLSGNTLSELSSSHQLGYCNTTLTTTCNSVKITTPTNIDERSCKS
ncbi:MAG: hypothetical protein J7L15_02975 [Clostridiales bacterium]|nr:hypothetical protein [Clostridiales bacterium]